MQLEEYWGIGPKTRATLEGSIGQEAAIEAIEAGDVGALVEAGVDASRATRVLRRAQNAEGMDLLATSDARSVYKTIIEFAADAAVSDEAAARIRTLTPLSEQSAIRDRLDAVVRGRDTWDDLEDDQRETVRDVFADFDAASGGTLAAVETVVALHDAGLTEGAFEPVAALAPAPLADAATALRALEDGRVREGADQELDRLRTARETVASMAANATGLVEDLRSAGVGDTAEFREALVDHLRAETSVDPARVRDAMATDAVDATGFVADTLRDLQADLERAVEERAAAVRADLEGDVDAARADVDRARAAVNRVARDLSLGRFAVRHDLRRPTFVEGDALVVRDARNLALLAAGESVQPVTYALGDHDGGLADGDRRLPSGQRVAVLTGANSGGKTTLLETLCQVQTLAHMGLPVPATEARVSPCDRLVFHRRHASFNAGVLESTLRSVVPPLVRGERTVMLVDEFEAITEPGRAADLLHGLVTLTVEEGALGAFVTHLADELEPLPASARTDGIFAAGLTDDLEIEVDYQPRFGEVGRSTPEFIVSRLVATADDHAEQAGFRTLAEAVDTEVVQRSLADARWADD
jgi:hypothetical protein